MLYTILKVSTKFLCPQNHIVSQKLLEERTNIATYLKWIEWTEDIFFLFGNPIEVQWKCLSDYFDLVPSLQNILGKRAKYSHKNGFKKWLVGEREWIRRTSEVAVISLSNFHPSMISCMAMESPQRFSTFSYKPDDKQNQINGKITKYQTLSWNLIKCWQSKKCEEEKTNFIKGWQPNSFHAGAFRRHVSNNTDPVYNTFGL